MLHIIKHNEMQTHSYQFQKCFLNNFQLKCDISPLVHSQVVFPKSGDTSSALNYTTTVTALMPYQFSVPSEVQNAKPTLSEPALRECSNSILISVYKCNPFCCLLYCSIKYNSFPVSKGISPDDLLNISSHALSFMRSHVRFFTTQHHSVSPAWPRAVRNTGMYFHRKCYEKQKHLIWAEMLNLCSSPFHRLFAV